MNDYILELRHITKRFPGVVALNDVHFQLKKGEIHALMGENGAGKSTLIKVITGVHMPDSGTILVKGREVVFQNTNDSAAESIAAIYQHSTAYPKLSVTENIFIGHEIRGRLGFLDWNAMRDEARVLLNSLGAEIDPRSLMKNLSVAEQQIVEIAKAISANAEIVIMDEPTAALSRRECTELYRIASQLRDEGKSILFISHRFEDMYRLADRVTVFRDAAYIGTWDIGQVDNAMLVKAMVGREIKDLYPKEPAAIGAVALEVKGLSRMGYFRDVSFQVRRGEIFGLTGLVGAGRSEVCQALCGFTRYDAGTVFLNGSPVCFTHPDQALKRKLGYLPENGPLYPDMSPRALLRFFGEARGITGRRLQERIAVVVELCSLKSVYGKPIGKLSKGFRQRVGMAQTLLHEPEVLILDEPTAGLDPNQIHDVREMLKRIGKEKTVLLSTHILQEVEAVASRVLFINEGRLVFDGSVEEFKKSGKSKDEGLDARFRELTKC